MKNVLLFVQFAVLVSSVTYSQKIIRVPQDYAVIQLAINAAAKSDTVLVDEGTYYENLRINKSIMVASNFALDGNKDHISKTIIDGSGTFDPDTASTIILGPAIDTNTVLKGFTIQGGTGTAWFDVVSMSWWKAGGGIFMKPYGARILSNRIINNSVTGTAAIVSVWGGGIAMEGAVTATGAPWVISDNFIAHNSVNAAESEDAGISASGVGIIRNNVIMNNTNTRNPALGSGSAPGGGLTVCMAANVDVEGNYIAKNYAGSGGAGITMYAWGGGVPTVRLKNNIVVDNNGGGGSGAVLFISGKYEMVNNTFANNTGAWAFDVYYLISRGPLEVRMLNNICWNPSATIEEFNYRQSGAPDVMYRQYNLFRTPIGGTNISGDPYFVTGDTLYRLSDSSRCISAGIYKWSVGGTYLTTPLKDYLGNNRPRPWGKRSDLGAIEHDMGDIPDPTLGVKDISEGMLPTAYVLDQNYPNPFNPTTTIHFSIPYESDVALTIFNVLGQQVEQLVKERLLAGVKEVRWDASRYPSGVYFCKLQGGKYQVTKKMLLIR